VPSGYATVYKASGEVGGVVALKVLKNALLSSLQREIAPLQEVHHPNVVKVLDYGTSERGQVYLAMEYLDGVTLREFCSRSTRVDEATARGWLSDLVSALMSFHPDDERVREFRSLQELTADQLAQLEEARHGFVHRDIKPENIVLADGRVVLIDFNISSRASTYVVTTSSTPGYTPPDGVGPEWTVDVDLYQLGVTILQVVLGVEDIRSVTVADLHLMAKDQLSESFARILTRMTAENRSQRFRNAAEIAKMLGPVSGRV
jgi:serine/threonine-protein kinase